MRIFRPLAAALAGLLCLPAAQAVGQTETLRGIPAPCPARAGDITALVLEGSGAPSGTITVFGQAFRPGDLPPGHQLAARLADGRLLPAQLDVATRHPDGSARFALVSLAVPAIARGERLGVILAVREGQRGAALVPEAVLAGREAMVELAFEGSTPWRQDLLAALRAPGAAWQSGPLAIQGRLALPVPAQAAGGRSSLRLVADVAARADGSLWVDLWLRNDVAMRPGGGSLGGPTGYRMRLLLDGREALRVDRLRQAHYTAFGRMAGVLRGGHPAPAPPLARHDAAYLAETGAVARYDLSTGVDPALAAQHERAVSAPDWAEPFGARGIIRYMPTGGGRPDIGPATEAQAAWLMTGDPRFAAYAVGQAEAAGSIPWHNWDPAGGSGEGGWLDAERWPLLWNDRRGGTPPGGLLQPMPEDTGWTPDTAHQPDLAFVPYLLTGRRAFLDALQAQAAWSVLAVWPHDRGAPASTLLVRGGQVRGGAWIMRQLDEAAWITPDADPQRAYFQAVAAANWAWLRARTAQWTREQGEPHGWIPGAYGDPTALPPWQQDYFASSAAAAARRGSEDARAVLAWMGNFLAGRFLAGPQGFDPHDGAAYLLAVAPAEAPNQPYTTWAQLGAATRGRLWSNGQGWARSEGDYGQLALQSLAALQDVTGSAAARRAYEWLLGAGAPLTRAADYARMPAFNITPRGAPRLPARAPRCIAATGRG